MTPDGARLGDKPVTWNSVSSPQSSPGGRCPSTHFAGEESKSSCQIHLQGAFAGDRAFDPCQELTEHSFFGFFLDFVIIQIIPFLSVFLIDI